MERVEQKPPAFSCVAYPAITPTIPIPIPDPAFQRTIQLSDYALFERHFPLFLSRPRPQVLHYWAAPNASLRWVDVLGMLRHIEQLYPRWQVQALFENQRNRYEVLLLDRRQTAGVHLVRTVAAFQRAVQ